MTWSRAPTPRCEPRRPRAGAESSCPEPGGRNFIGRGRQRDRTTTSVFTEKGCERVMRFAFDLARTRSVKKVSERHQVECSAVRHGALGRGVRPRRARLPGRHHRERLGRRDECGGFVLHPRGPVRRGRVESARRHPFRSRLRPRPAALAWPARRTSTPSGAFPACSSRCTARPCIAGKGIANPIGAIAGHADARSLRAARGGPPHRGSDRDGGDRCGPAHPRGLVAQRAPTRSPRPCIAALRPRRGE